MNVVPVADCVVRERPADVAEVRPETRVDTVVYVYPFSHPTNAYLANFRRNLSAAGFEVRSASELWKGRALLPARQRRYIFLNWFEDRVLRKQSKPRLLEIVGFCYKLLAIGVQRVSIVWVRHNHRAHGQDVSEWFANSVLRLLAWSSSSIVVHAEGTADENDWNYLPHPLYDRQTPQPNLEFANSLEPIDQRIAVLGQIRESKQLDAMLREWPQQQPLILAGKPASSEYARRIEHIIAERELDVVTIFRNLSHDEFDYILCACKAIYIANPDETMVVSGVFFHAASAGTPVILKRSKFADEVCQRCRFAFAVSSPNEIASVLGTAAIPDRSEIVSEAESLWGQEQFIKKLKELLPDQWLIVPR